MKETEIPKKMYMSNFVMKKVDVFNRIDRSIVKVHQFLLHVMDVN